MNIEPDKLREKLEHILDFMVNEKLISKEASEKMKDEKGGILDALAENLCNSGMEEKDLRDVSFQNKLMGTLVSSTLGRTADAKMGMDALANALTLKSTDSISLEESLSNPEANKILDKTQALNVVISSALNNDRLHLDPLKQNGPKPDFGATAKHMLADFNKNMEKKFDKNETEKKEFQELSKEMEKQLADTLRNAYGGDDPRIAGEVTGPVMGPILTVMADWIEPEANPTSVAARVMEATENSPGNDPLGVKDKHKATIDQAADILSSIGDSISAELNRPKLEHK